MSKILPSTWNYAQIELDLQTVDNSYKCYPFQLSVLYLINTNFCRMNHFVMISELLFQVEQQNQSQIQYLE